MTASPSAIVFAYHTVGVRCLEVLLDGGVDVRLVVSHRDNPSETIWFQSVAALAAERGIPCILPDDPNTSEVLARARAAAPDFLFSFYYRHMLNEPLLAVPRRGAFNMHGSLLPQFRGRVPVNWALIHGATETGSTLHVMNEKPDNGPIVDQCAVPILGNDSARDVFVKVTVAAEIVLARSLPQLIAGTATLTPQDLRQGGYFCGRRPEDGRIPPAAGAAQIHNLVRALASPFPGAFFDAGAHRIVLQRTAILGTGAAAIAPAASTAAASAAATAPPTGRIAPTAGGFELRVEGSRLHLIAVDGVALRVFEGTLDGLPLTPDSLAAAFGTSLVTPNPDHL